MQLFTEIGTTIVQSKKELRSLSSLTSSAMLSALSMVINRFTISFTPTLRLSFAFLATALGGMLYGPLLAGLMGIVVDVLRYLVVGGGAFFPGFTLNEFLSGMLYGMFLYRHKPTLPRIMAARGCITVFINLGLTPLWLSMLYGNSTYWGLMTERVLKNVIMYPIEVALLLVVCRMVYQYQAKQLRPA